MRPDIACKMEYARDEFGKEILLKDGKFQVMMEWERPYMQACIDALQPFGDVLEVGFGCGYSATHIQSFKPKSHTIIEYHPVVAERAREWAKQYPNVIIVEDTWQNALARLGVFDAIFFDDYPLESEQQIHTLEKSKQQSHALLEKGNQLLQEVAQVLPELNAQIYSDADLQELIDQFNQTQTAQIEHLVRFLSELSARKQITQEQEAHVLEKVGYVAPKQETSKPPFQFRGPSERVMLFLEQVLNHHMRNGSRFSCFLSSSVSKYDDPKFVDAIICNPYLDYAEQKIAAEVPPNCAYYADTQALVMTITKRS